MDITKDSITTETEKFGHTQIELGFPIKEITKETAKKESNIKETIQEYDLFFEHLIFPRILIDEDNKVLKANKAIRNLLRLENDEIINKDVISLFKDNLGIKIIARLKQLVGEVASDQFEIAYSPRKEINMLFSVVIIRLGKIGKYIVTFIDITKERRMEEQLKRKNQELLQLYETGKTLQQTLDIDETLDIAMKTFTQIGFDRVRIYFYDETEHAFVGKKASDTSYDKFREIKVPIIPEHSKVYHCFTNKTPIIREEKNKDSFYSKALRKEDVYESASLPLVNKERVLGMISLDNKYSKRKIEEESLHPLMTFAQQISVAIENSLLYASSIRRLNRLSAIYDIAKISSSTFDSTTVLNQIVLKIVKMMHIDFCSILLLDEDGKTLNPRIGYSYGKGKVSTYSLPFDNCISGESILKKKTIYVQDVLKDKNYQYKDLAESEHLKSMLCVPLIVDNSAIGTLSVYTKKTRRFSQDEINLLEALADHAGIIVKKTELYDKITKDNENFSLLLELGRVINSTLKTEDLLKLCLEKAVEFTKADFGFILLIENEALTFKYTKGYNIENTEALKLKVGEGICGYAASAGIPIIVNNVETYPQYIKLNDLIKSEAAIPIIRNNKVIGILDLESSKINNFSEYSRALQVLTNQMAVALENATLVDEISNFNEKLKHEIDVATKELREKNKELEKMDKLKSDFVSNVSHELRTPLTSIKGYTQLLFEERIGKVDEQQKHCLKIVLEESDRLTRLINDVLDLSKLEHGKIKFKLEKVQIIDLAVLVINTMMMIAHEKEITINYEFEKDLPIISASRDLIKQVFINILGNAIKFTQKGGEIFIFIKKKNNNGIEVSIKDSCPGIPPESIHKIFDKFYQVDSSMTREHSGTGLGLAIAKHIINIHQGEIWVESEVGKGCVFTFTLPLKREKR
ncbi:GAF domain-containing protein [Candidatus Woesearchaeota archaeon]|nr:GAF domain-containing protein [Candidatus Woesearchaeota archaeon]